MLFCCIGGYCLSGGGPSAVVFFFFCWAYHIVTQALIGFHLSSAMRVWFQVYLKFVLFLVELSWVVLAVFSGYYKDVSFLQEGFPLVLQFVTVVEPLTVASGTLRTIACLLCWSVLLGLPPLCSCSLIVSTTWPGVIWLKSWTWTLSGLWMLALLHSCGVSFVSYCRPVVLHNINRFLWGNHRHVDVEEPSTV